MDSDIIEQAKNKIYNSTIINYVPKAKIEEAFNRIYIYEDKEEFLKAYGLKNFDKNDRLEGFNRNSGNYLGPDATVHTVIHEVLHGLSSEFDIKGHRVKNGIMGDGKLNFANEVNEGLTDYLATKLSEEKPRHYFQGHKLFSRLEPMLEKYSQNSDILMKIYLNNDVKYIEKFLNTYGKRDTFETLYDNFLFMNDEKLNNMLDDMEKKFSKEMKVRNRKEKINKFFEKIKRLFSQKNKKTPLLEEKHEPISNNGTNNKEFIPKAPPYNNSKTKSDIEKTVKTCEKEDNNIRGLD